LLPNTRVSIPCAHHAGSVTAHTRTHTLSHYCLALQVMPFVYLHTHFFSSAGRMIFYRTRNSSPVAHAHTHTHLF